MITRFAPSPTGPLHLGHAYSAMLAHDRARAAGGRFLLRIEDTDRARSRPEWEALIFEDLRWLGLNWPEPVLRQSEHGERYAGALARLDALGLIYPCACSRADIRAALSAPQEGDAPPAYPGTCRHRAMDRAEPGDAIRLNLPLALAHLDGRPLWFQELGSAHARKREIPGDPSVWADGDPVLQRRGTGDFAYLLAAVVDDGFQGITDVIRGLDLFDFTPLQVLLFHLLSLPVPRFYHHRLIRDDQGKRLAKRDDARAIRRYRADGMTPDALRRLLELPAAI